MFDLEGINNITSDIQRSRELSESARDYFNEVIPTAEEWRQMSAPEKNEAWQVIESRMQEICNLANVRVADVSKHIPDYICMEAENCEFPFCSDAEFFEKGKIAVKDFWEKDELRDIPYADADIKLRATYMKEFYNSFSELTGTRLYLSFTKMGPRNMGAYNPENNTITLNRDLLEKENPDKLMSTILHEARHAYQHFAVEHPDRVTVSAETIAEWKENYDYYIHPEYDFNAYVNQPVEVDADCFADLAMYAGYSLLA